MADLRSIATELYALPLAEFTAARNERARDATHDGDRALAAAVRALRKPSASAWAVNQLARQRPDLLTEVVDLGEQLRHAQASADGPRLRSLDQERRALLRRVAEESVVVARDRGQRLGVAAAPGIEDTMRAALADPAAAEAMTSGMLAESIEAPGLGPADLSEVLAVPDELARARRARRTTTASPDGTAAARAQDRAREREAERARARVAEATKVVARAREVTDAAAEATRAARAAREELATERRELERRLAALAQRAETIDREISDARRAEAKAEQALERAEGRLDRMPRS